MRSFPTKDIVFKLKDKLTQHIASCRIYSYIYYIRIIYIIIHVTTKSFVHIAHRTITTLINANKYKFCEHTENNNLNHGKKKKTRIKNGK